MPGRLRHRRVESRAAAPATRNPKPVAVISSPLRLSGRRRQAISPHAANEPPMSRSTTSTASIGLAPAQDDGREHAQLGQPGRHPEQAPQTAPGGAADPGAGVTTTARHAATGSPAIPPRRF